tara:strand:- start:1489 stop:1890 length:402 start_codon:yes stop_codon:yes gene_type:complete
MANIESLNKVREAQHKLITKQLRTKQPNGRTVGEQHVIDLVKRGAFDSHMHDLYISLKCDFSDIKHLLNCKTQADHQAAFAFHWLKAGRLADRIGRTQATILAYQKHLVSVASVKADRQAETVNKYFAVMAVD